ncbi:MAG: RNA polymerase sigma factor [Thermoleophilia bacterium]
MPEASDGELVRRAQRGSREAAAVLFGRHWRSAWRAAYAVTGRHASADDIAQDAFERAFSRIASFDPSRPFAPWLHRIVVNRAVDVARRERRLLHLPSVPEVADPAGEARPGERDGAAVDAVARLAPDRRAVVVLRYLLDYAPPEIAEMIGVPVGTVNSRLARALAELREELAASDG